MTQAQIEAATRTRYEGMLHDASIEVAFGNAPFQQQPSEQAQQTNGLNGRPFPMVTQIILQKAGADLDDNRWITKAQMNRGGWEADRDAKPVKVVYFADTSYTKDTDGRPVMQKLQQPELRMVSLYNVAQTNCDKAVVPEQSAAQQPISDVSKALANITNKKNLNIEYPGGTKNRFVVDLAKQMAGHKLGVIDNPPVLNEAQKKMLIEDKLILARSVRLSGQMARFISHPEHQEEIKRQVALSKELQKVNDGEVSKTEMAKRTYLHVPFRDKDKAKELGATWDPHNKQWFASKDVAKDERIAQWKEKPLEVDPVKNTQKVKAAKKTVTKSRSGSER